jgi:hypothetical protein
LNCVTGDRQGILERLGNKFDPSLGHDMSPDARLIQSELMSFGFALPTHKMVPNYPQ